MTPSTLILLIIGVPWAGALIVWLVGDAHPRLQNTLAVVFALATAGASVALIPQASSAVALDIPLGGAFGNFTFVADGLGVFLAAVATVIGALAVIFSIDYMRGEAGLGRYYAFVLFFIGGMAGLVLTSNLLLLFFFWEITALCSYALISFNNDDPKAVRGGMKALIMTQIGGIGLLLGALFIYSYLGSFDLNVFIAQSGTLPGAALAIAGFGFLIAAAAKSAQFPFQTWLPDAMEAPTPISALIHAATMVNAGVYLLVRFYPAFSSVPYWRTAVIFVGVMSALMAAVMALVSTDIKRVLAYSTVSQLGYMVYAVGVGGVFASQFHLLSHSIFKALLFLGAGAVIHSVGTRDMRLMGGLGKRMRLVQVVFVIGGLALAGIPILNGFWSKELILESGLGPGAPIGAFIIMVLVAGLTALYTFRLVWLVFYGEPRTELHVHPAGQAMRVSLIFLAAGTLTSWLVVGPFSRLMASTLPMQEIEALPSLTFFKEIVTTPYTLVALVVIALGLAAWWWRARLEGVSKALSGVGEEAANSFGFEDLNNGIVKVTQSSAEALRATQTGVLNWNILAIVAAVALVFVILALGA